MNPEMTLIELGKECSSKCQDKSACANDDEDRCPHEEPRDMGQPLECPHIAPLEECQQLGLHDTCPTAAQDQERERRRDDQGDDERREDRYDVRQTKRAEEGTLHSRQRDNRKEHQCHDEGGIDHTRPHLERGVDDDLRCRTRHGQGSVLSQPTRDVLDVDDRIIHDLTNGDGESAEGKRVEGEPEAIEHDKSRYERQGDRRERHRRRPQIGEEQQQHDRHENATDQERADDIMQRQLDEGAWTEERALQ